jgi:hypothetical protein
MYLDTIDIVLSSLSLKGIIFTGYFNDVLYVVSNNSIITSNDNGNTWTNILLGGLSFPIYSFAYLNGNIIVGTINGIYYLLPFSSEWSLGITSVNPITIILNGPFLIATDGTNIFVSNDGIFWVASGNVGNNFINSMILMNNVVYISSGNQLYTDGGSFFSGSPSIYQIGMLLPFNSDNISLNSIATDGNYLFCGFSNGYLIAYGYGKFFNCGYMPLNCIHNLQIIENMLFIFSFNQFLILQINDGNSNVLTINEKINGNIYQLNNNDYIQLLVNTPMNMVPGSPV